MRRVSVRWFVAVLAMSALGSIAGFDMAVAQEKVIKVAVIYDLTKAYACCTPTMAQGIKDHADVVNLRGGIEGHKVDVIVVDHGNEPQRGIEHYERLNRDGAVTFDFLSTPVSRAVLPRALKDHQVMIQMLTGRADATDGTTYPWIFPLAPTYWAQAANIVQYIADQAGGDPKGKKVAFLYIDYPFGQEPIPILEELSKRLGFDLGLFPYPLPGNDQSGAWTKIRRYQPDWVIHWGFGALHVLMAREAMRNGIPMEKLITVNWISNLDVQNMGGVAAKGLKRSDTVSLGTEPQPIRDILADLYDKGKGNGDRKWVGDYYYNVGVAAYATVFEGMRIALQTFGPPLTSEKLKKGLESLKDFDARGMMPAITLTPSDHQGGGQTRISMWDGEKWIPQSNWMAAYDDLVWRIVKQHAAEFRKAGD